MPGEKARSVSFLAPFLVLATSPPAARVLPMPHIAGAPAQLFRSAAAPGLPLPQAPRLCPAAFRAAVHASPRTQGLSAREGAFRAAPRVARNSLYDSPSPVLCSGPSSAGFKNNRISPRAMATEAGDTPGAVEHLVLFKVKPGTEAAAEEMVDALNALSTLPGVVHLAVGARVPMTEAEGGWTHALYGRYESRAALDAYAKCRPHVEVVVKKVRPILEEIVAVDWEVTGPGWGADTEARVFRAVVLEIEDSAAQEKLGQGLEAAEELRAAVPEAVRWVSIGKNFAPERAKGFTWGSVAAFVDEAGLKEYTGHEKHSKLFNEGLVAASSKTGSIDFKFQAKL